MVTFKNSDKMKHFVFPIAILAILFTACSVKIDSPAEASDSPFYEVTIPASLDSGAPETRAVTFDGTTSSGSFKTTEKVYVYNISKKKLLSSALSPSKNGKTCNLTGTFGKDEVSDGDALLLVYNANSLNIPYYCRFNYANQNGTQEGVVDGATASVSASVSGGKVTTSIVAAFENEQSMFRFQFTDGTNNISVSKLTIKSNNLALAYMYDPDPVSPSRAADDIRVTPDSPTSDYLYVAISIKEDKADGDVLTFIVTDDEGKVYKGTKAAPAGGFQNGKYYCNDTPITLTYQYTKVKPTITWNSVKDGLAVEPDENDRYNIYGPGGTGPIDISISSNSAGYQFYFNSDATVHISGNIDINWQEEYYCLYPKSWEYALTLDISGANNTIHCLNYSGCAYGKPLKLKGNGNLSVFVNNYAYCGLVSDPDYQVGTNFQGTTDELDVTAELAADGYTVTRSKRYQSGSTYYWTYIVKPVTP